MRILFVVALVLGVSGCSTEAPKPKPKPRPEVRLTENLRPYAKDIRTGAALRKKLGGSSVNYGNGRFSSMKKQTLVNNKIRDQELKRLGVK